MVNIDDECTEKDKPSLLLVEDDVELAEWISDYLVAKDFYVTVTGRGDGAVILIKRNNPELVILDGMLPGLGGLDVCRDDLVSELRGFDYDIQTLERVSQNLCNCLSLILEMVEDKHYG